MKKKETGSEGVIEDTVVLGWAGEPFATQPPSFGSGGDGLSRMHHPRNDLGSFVPQAGIDLSREVKTEKKKK